MMLYDKKFYKYIGCCAVYFVFTICYLFFSNATTVWQASWFSDKFFVYQYAIVLLLGYSIISSYYNSQTYNRFETRKRIVTNQLLLAMLLSLPAYAASPRVMTILPAISFDGTTANCRVSVSADRSTDQISAVIQLWNGSTRIARWTDSGTGYLLFSNSATVSKGKTYELTVDVKINGVSKPQVSIEGTCK